MLMKTNQEARQALMQTSSNAILSVGFGLQAQKSVGREDKMIGTGVQIALKRVRFFVGPDPQIPRKCSLQRIIYTNFVYIPHCSASNLRGKRCLQKWCELMSHGAPCFVKIAVHYVRVKGTIHVTITRNRQEDITRIARLVIWVAHSS